MPGRDTAGWGGSESGNTGRGRAGSGEPGPAVAGADAASAARSSYDRSDGTGTRSSYGPSDGTRTSTSYDSSGSTRAADPYDLPSGGATRSSDAYDPDDRYDQSSGVGRRFDESSRSFEAGPGFEFAPPVPAGRPRRGASAGPAGGAFRDESAPASEPEPEPVAVTAPAPGPLVVDRRTRQVWVGDSPVSLTPKEFELLALLTEDPGAVYSRQQILDRVWDPHYQGPTKTLDVHVATLRRKLGNSAWIQTLRGVGFRLAVQNRPPSAGGAPGGTLGGATGGSYGEQPGRPNGSYGASALYGASGSAGSSGSTGSYGSFESFESFGSSGAYDDLPDGGSQEPRPAAFR
ncbi:winged helix-turn-helix domain-containing protein [Streptomyces sp. NPDC058656]|uniref:winged helix-turn-helix domain-containing protein n=1 Tax=Streptomyces sp. NPDC058656 TaxID=3346578 RepID=UPI00365716E5